MTSIFDQFAALDPKRERDQIDASVSGGGASGPVRSIQYNNGSGLGGAANFSVDVNGNPNVAIAGQYLLGGSTAIQGAPARNNWFFGPAGNTTATGLNNIGIGINALHAITTPNYNTAMGYTAGAALTTGANNVAIGGLALTTATTDTSNVAVGYTALQKANGGGSNTAVGVAALSQITTGTNNVAVGTNAVAGQGSGGAAGNNTGVGYNCLSLLQTGTNNTCVGYSAGVSITSGGSNIVLGNSAGAAIVTGSSNILIGGNAPSDTTSYINIGGLITGQMNTGPIAISKAVNFTGSIGVNGTTAPAKPTVTGAKGSNAAVASLIAALVSYGLIVDSTTA